MAFITKTLSCSMVVFRKPARENYNMNILQSDLSFLTLFCAKEEAFISSRTLRAELSSDVSSTSGQTCVSALRPNKTLQRQDGTFSFIPNRWFVRLQVRILRSTCLSETSFSYVIAKSSVFFIVYEEKDSENESGISTYIHISCTFKP